MSQRKIGLKIYHFYHFFRVTKSGGVLKYFINIYFIYGVHIIN